MGLCPSVCVCLSVCHKSVEFRGDLWHQKTIESLRYRAVLFYCDPVFSRFIRTPTCFAVSLCLLKCQRQLLGIRWCDRVRNDEVLQRTGLNWLSRLLSRRRISVFGHVARLDDVTPANMALQLHIDVSLNRPPDRTWRRPPGRPRNNWLEQLRNDSTRPTGELWRRAVDRGHGGATTRRPSPATRPRCPPVHAY